ncbi:MAG TPA: DoxX family protein [Elusimicrobia bacterium]|nr:MAG: hypothetical protein A2X37_08295 [Elusimicrobia bacterium GWA2_66_18]OGR72016.1 MAG: hypothetical protein A2X40_05235 [Elusimicrobia bacterium GWC2_65_9]HAZ09437.1 DoxX family protein [Elusimicrobiota bacterium]
MTRKEHAALASRLAVGAVLIYAGSSKAAGPVEEFAYILAAYDVLPKDFLLPAAAFLPWIELLLGWSLILGYQTRLAAAAAGALFAGFLAALASTILRGISLPNCGCFGESLHFTPAQAFFMDLCLLILCGFGFQMGHGPASLDSWSERGL